MPVLPSGWEERFSRSKNIPYYFCQVTGESKWEFPSNVASTTVPTHLAGSSSDNQVRVSHILAKHRDSRRPSSWRRVK